MLTLNIKPNLKPLQRAFLNFHAKQAPFATALALTALAKGVEKAEDQGTVETFASPTPFTQKAFRTQPATKTRPVAIVYPKDIQAEYLAPYILGGDRSLGGKKGMLVPIGAKTNQYGNLGKDQLARLKAKPGVFVGAITTKTGKRISGIWQRPPAAKAGKRTKAGAIKPVAPLKLLIEFEDSSPAPKRLPVKERAAIYVRRNAAREFDTAMRRALATAR